ncbi:YggS family pyridoxal phosphate-dependent enzyme [Enterococcus villorum]|uniref:Pyridoxal phosphate homeostasis protein n=2 Tax=Enterococcus villorum TaxID=112904 RepID=A0A511IZH4_9ENTE|nr:YggS family pyridoxal phosphate-dependent enzyme [Enterococcus villorum]EOH89295.1 YggS family pyridoxal phosphate enzyme [Enterococcus villorum ATCC 700913]EOW76103.1 YggS family pyridoxal phosphate enzyme [Enterococcus villorum ATCC 700913]GEL91157.1 YggS family pyridoxal phosphate enzyme [Enterococcus villorum]
MIADNLLKIEQEIQDSCALVHRDPKEVTLIAVTKSVDSATAEKLIKSGIKNCAENRVDKLLQKKQDLLKYPDVKWHLIGNLQRRKVKLIINEIDCFHALDSLKLAEEIQKRVNQSLDCFVEVNVSGEESKHGISPEELLPFVESLAALTKINIVGLMTMAPKDASVQQIRKVFRTLKELRDLVQMKKFSHAPCTELSMGMSQDFQLAIEEGATFIRVGTALFKDEEEQ